MCSMLPSSCCLGYLSEDYEILCLASSATKLASQSPTRSRFSYVYVLILLPIPFVRISTLTTASRTCLPDMLLFSLSLQPYLHL
jgi:hypothetical protein